MVNNANLWWNRHYFLRDSYADTEKMIRKILIKSIMKSSFSLSSQYDYIVLYRVVFLRWFPSHSHADLYRGYLVASTLSVAPDTSSSGHQVLGYINCMA